MVRTRFDSSLLQPVEDSPGDSSLPQLYIQEEPGTRVNRERENQTIFDRTAQTAVDIIDRVTRAPQAISDTADRLNDALIDTGRQITQRGGAKAEENLKQGKINQLGKQAINWLQKPANAGLVIVGILILFWLRGR